MEDFKGTAGLSFDQYRYYLQSEVFAVLPDTVGNCNISLSPINYSCPGH